MQIAFYRGRKRWLDRLIQWWSRGPYSHCELVLEKAPNGTHVCASSSWVDGGVRMKAIDLSGPAWVVVDVPVSLDTVRQAEEWFRRHDGEGYDILGLVGMVLRTRNRADGKRWFCSEAVAAALGWSEPWRLDPTTLNYVLAWRWMPIGDPTPRL
ncbi:hypothetical protein [Cupriavidus metallidurans]|uniref:Enoyl-CoA hydratase n=1 Tax=Cupriavidus metallidurans TaxID=119219 RepID=A0A482IL81_9BURK|nr:hypothetical protein [Cupriavidus metallidurans]QBP09865.1 hypothetical protein DDF84_008870 [Cupriavidus metallidurans]